MLHRTISFLSFTLCAFLGSSAMATPTIVSLEPVEAATGQRVVVQLNMSQPDDSLRPVLADFRIEYDQDVLQFVEVRGQAEGKKAFAAPTKNGALRLTLTGVTLETIKPGALAIIVFKLGERAVAKRTQLRITESSKLAPRAANTHVRIAPALNIELGQGRQK